jgi:hypothetical protein
LQTGGLVVSFGFVYDLNLICTLSRCVSKFCSRMQLEMRTCHFLIS